MRGGGVRSEETGQPAGRTRGTKDDGHNERRRQMGGGSSIKGLCVRVRHVNLVIKIDRTRSCTAASRR